MENEKSEEANRPVTGWDKVHAFALCVLAVVGGFMIHRVEFAKYRLGVGSTAG